MRKYIIKLWSTQADGGQYYWRLYVYDPCSDSYLPVGGRYMSPVSALDCIQVRLLEEMDYFGYRKIRDGEVLLYHWPDAPDNMVNATVEIISNPGYPDDKRHWSENTICNK